MVSGVIAQRTSAESIQKLTEVGIPCAQVNSLADVLAHPHTQHSGLVARYDGGPFGMLQAIVPPIRFDGQRIDPTRAPPKLGEHSANSGRGGIRRRRNSRARRKGCNAVRQRPNMRRGDGYGST